MKTYVIIGGKWFDKTYGNTYHVSKIIDIETRERFYTEIEYGYGTQYMESALIYIRKELTQEQCEIIDGGSFYIKLKELKNNYF